MAPAARWRRPSLRTWPWAHQYPMRSSWQRITSPAPSTADFRSAPASAQLITAGGSASRQRSASDLARLDARGADIEALGGAPQAHAHALNIRVPAARGAAV